MRKINILYVITQLELGGAQKQALEVLRRIDRTRYSPFLFTAKEGLLIEEALSIPGLTLQRSQYLGRRIHPVKDVLAILEIAEFIRQNGIDIVHTHSSKAGILGRWAAAFCKVRVILHTVHGWSFNDLQRGLVRRFYIALERMSAKFSDRIIVVSHHDRRRGLDFKIGREGQYALVRYGIDRASFDVKDLSIRRELGIGEETLVVGTIACFKPQKALEDFVQLVRLTIQIVPQVRFLLVGDGVFRKRIERLITQYHLGPNIILTGWRRDIPRILSALDVFVLTSLWEGLPISVLEAMATKLPVVATHTGGVSEVVVEGETGFLVSCHDLPSMLKKVVVLLKDASLRNRIGTSAKSKVDESFSVENMVRVHEDLYQSLIKTKGEGVHAV